MMQWAAATDATRSLMVHGGRTLASLVKEQIIYPGRGRDGLEIRAVNIVDAILRGATQPVPVFQERDLFLYVTNRWNHLAVVVDVGVVLGEAAALPVDVNCLGLEFADRAAAEDDVLSEPVVREPVTRGQLSMSGEVAPVVVHLALDVTVALVVLALVRPEVGNYQSSCDDGRVSSSSSSSGSPDPDP